MAAPKFSDDRAARPIGWNRSVLVSEPSWRPIAGLALTSPIARHSAKSSSVLSSTRGSLLYPWGSPALRRTIAALTPSSSNLRNVLPDLGDHFKSGQRLSLQNRPTGLAVQD